MDDHTGSRFTMRTLVAFTASMCLLNVVTAIPRGPDQSVCDPTVYAANAKNTPGPPKPKLPNQWSVRVEANFMNTNPYTADIQEFYDGINDRGAIMGHAHGHEFKQIFLYKTGELLTISFPQDGNLPKCQVEDLAKSPEKRVFGLRQLNNGSEYMFSANNALRFAGTNPEVFTHLQKARDDIWVDTWESCLYEPSTETTVKNTWSFSANQTWQTASNLVIPVQLDVVGKRTNASGTFDIRIEIVLTDFTPSIFYGPIRAFETPVGTVCPNRALTKPMPNMTQMFTFSSEILGSLPGYVGAIQEYYDYDLNLVRYDYTAAKQTYSRYGYNKLYRVHDFNTGVAYTLDSVLGNCTASKISVGFDDNSASDGTVRMRKDRQFFYMNNSTFVYIGQRTVRGITCDVYQTIRSDFPSGNPNPHSIWEWYFASAEWIEILGCKNVRCKAQSMLPIKFEVIAGDGSFDLTYNVYEYTEGRPDIWKTDVSSCFVNKPRQIYSLSFPAVYKDVVVLNLGLFRLSVLQTISILGDISPLRINRMEVVFLKNNLLITFAILDKAPVAGDAQKNSFVDLSLADVDMLMTNAVTSGQFQVLLDKATFTNLPSGPMVASFYKPTSSSNNVFIQLGSSSGSNGYGGGAMAGLGIAMLVVGLGLGFAVLFIIYKKKGGSFTDSFAPKTFGDKEKEVESQ